MSPRPAASLAAFVSIIALGLGTVSPLPSNAEEPTVAEPAPPQPPVTAEYRKTLARMLELTGGSAAGEQLAYAAAQETLSAIAATGTPITEQIQQIVLDEALADFVPVFGDIETLTNLYAPFYAKHISQTELDQLLAFYESPIGKKTLSALPVVHQEGAMALQQAGLARLPDLQTKVDKKLRDAGITITP